jgi:quaternary ammonium compound-resistance protein SugE
VVGSDTGIASYGRDPKNKMLPYEIGSPRRMRTFAWTLLLIAGLFEVGWAVGLEYSDGLTEPLPTAVTIVALVASMVLLARAMQTLPIGTAYAVWTGIGAVGTVTLGILLFDEPATSPRLFFIGVVVVGIAGLYVVSGGH